MPERGKQANRSEDGDQRGFVIRHQCRRSHRCLDAQTSKGALLDDRKCRYLRCVCRDSRAYVCSPPARPPRPWSCGRTLFFLLHGVLKNYTTKYQMPSQPPSFDWNLNRHFPCIGLLNGISLNYLASLIPHTSLYDNARYLAIWLKYLLFLVRYALRCQLRLFNVYPLLNIFGPLFCELGCQITYPHSLCLGYVSCLNASWV